MAERGYEWGTVCMRVGEIRYRVTALMPVPYSAILDLSAQMSAEGDGHQEAWLK